MAFRSPYAHTLPKFILAFDVGITCSGISFYLRRSEDLPTPNLTSMFLSHGPEKGHMKFPSVLYYNNEGVVQVAGADTLDDGMHERAEEQGWSKAEWFKVHLRPRPVRNRDDPFRSLPPLPVALTALQVYGDYLKYLYKCARRYIEDSQPDGSALWTAVEQSTKFVISHPSGWGELQRSYIRRAVVSAGLVPDEPTAQERVSFVTDEEANLHFAIHRGLIVADINQHTRGIIIVDAGGVTINVSAYQYSICPAKPTFDTIVPPKCYLLGSSSVSNRLRDTLHDVLAGSSFVGDIDHIVGCFDQGTKLRFGNSEDDQFIRFGRRTINEPALNIRSGQLKLSGSDVAACFVPSLRCIIDAIKETLDCSPTPVTDVILVGGFSANTWLYDSINKAMAPLGLVVSRPESLGGRSVSEGAIASILDQYAQGL